MHTIACSTNVPVNTFDGCHKIRTWPATVVSWMPSLWWLKCCLNNNSIEVKTRHGWHLRRCHGPGWLWLGGKPFRDCSPDGVTLNAQRTPHWTRSRPTLAPWCTRAPLACPDAESGRNNPRPVEQGMNVCKTWMWYVRIRDLMPNFDSCCAAVLTYRLQDQTTRLSRARDRRTRPLAVRGAK